MSSDMEDEDIYAYKKLEKEFKEFLQFSLTEIEDLRHEIAYLQPRSEAYTHIVTLTGVIADLRRQPQGMKEDVSWKIKQRLEKFK